MSMKYLEMYVAQEWAIFPCNSKDKSPLTVHGCKDASSDIVVVEAWHAKHPGCAWGFATIDKVAVVDIDPRHGGDVSWNALIDVHGPLPPTVKATTGSAGSHYY